MDNEVERIFRVGSRKSELALVQTKYVIGRLQKLHPRKKFEIHTMSTIGDRVLNVSLPKIGEKSLFTRDLEDALRNGGVDFVVHSLKDLPTSLPIGMAIGAVLEREDARDALVLRNEFKGHSISTLPEGSVIGTSSLRRTAQIRRLYPHLVVCDIRGNLNTRLAKLDAPDSKFSGIVLAQAGLVRMGWTERISQVLEPTDLLYAVGQGALAIECRSNDSEVLEMMQSLICVYTSCRILAERSFLKTLGGGCSAPVAVDSKLIGNLFDANKNDAAELTLTGAVWSLDGVKELRAELFSSLPTEYVSVKKVTTAILDANGNDADEHIEPLAKRKKNNDNTSPERQSPPIINDTADIDNMALTYELIEKHISLVKKCPIMGAAQQADNRGGGDADVFSGHCPLPLNVGQDFMGQCPVVDNEAKIALSNTGKCPITNDDATTKQQVDQVDCIGNGAAKPTTSKCPFSTLHKVNNSGIELPSATHGKCPFLQKTVKMFDYNDEEKPAANEVSLLIEDVDNLFCGLYQHKFISRELYVKSNNLGQELAEQLIKIGALEVMKCAQAEIHAKS